MKNTFQRREESLTHVFFAKFYNENVATNQIFVNQTLRPRTYRYNIVEKFVSLRFNLSFRFYVFRGVVVSIQRDKMEKKNNNNRVTLLIECLNNSRRNHKKCVRFII